MSRPDCLQKTILQWWEELIIYKRERRLERVMEKIIIQKKEIKKYYVIFSMLTRLFKYQIINDIDAFQC